MSAFDAVCKSVAFTDVTITSPFWNRTTQTVKEGSLPAIYQQMKDTGRWDCLKLKWRQGDPNPPHRFWDSDVAKWVEAACYSLALKPDPELAHLVEEAVDNIRGAQQEDGYLNTYYSVVEPGKRWTNISWSHEMYDAGHLLEAALAHHIYTHSTRLLDPILRYIKHIRREFGLEDGQRAGYPGHQELELALLKTYEYTGDKSLLELADYFIEERGRHRSGKHYYDVEAEARGEKPNIGPGPKDAPRWSYHQADRPIREMESIEGHSVRAMYWLTAAANLARLKRDESLLFSVERLWESTTRHKMYVTGGLGAMPDWEGFGPDYYLPNESGYLETCAAIGLVFFSHQMLLINPWKPEYANVLELALHNAALGGMSLDGTKFFYENPLATIDKHLERSAWFEVSCCPPNVARLFGAMGKYLYTKGEDDTVFVHLYIASTVELALSDGTIIRIVQESKGPWDGRAEFSVEGPEGVQVKLNFRKPLGAKSLSVHVRGRPILPGAPAHQITYTIHTGGAILVLFPYSPRLIHPHPLDFENRNCVALARGPFVYCVESIDNGDIHDLRSIRLVWDDISTLKERIDDKNFVEWDMQPIILEIAANVSENQQSKRVILKLIPIFLWANRGKSDLRVWLPLGES